MTERIRPKFVNMTKKFTTVNINMVNMTEICIDGTERSPKGRFSCRGMLDFDEDCMFDVIVIMLLCLVI